MFNISGNRTLCKWLATCPSLCGKKALRKFGIFFAVLLCALIAGLSPCTISAGELNAGALVLHALVLHLTVHHRRDID
jgi:hypothetical protein